MPGTFVNCEDVGSVIPRGTPAVWLNSEGRAVCSASLYMNLNEEGRKDIHAEMDRLEREHANSQADSPAPSPVTLTTPITPADRLARSAEGVNVTLLDLIERLTDFRDNLKTYGTTQGGDRNEPD